MKKLIAAPNLVTAHLMADFLREAGIETVLLNQYAAGAIGELPVDTSRPQLWLKNPNQEAYARSLLETFERRTVTSANWRCARCGENNPDNFDVCWQCGTEFVGK